MTGQRTGGLPGRGAEPCRRAGPGSLVALLCALFVSSCFAVRPPPAPPVMAPYQEGVASWYGPGFHARPTASGEVFDQARLTAAHPTLPFGTRVRVVRVENGREVVVRINDRGPFVRGRIIDLSRAAAESLGMIDVGTALVRVFIVERATTD